MSNKNENENKQETLASTTTSQTTATTTTTGTGTIASNSNMQYGWVCPRCGKVNAPWKASCDCYLNIPYTPPNTPAPSITPFNPTPSWPQAPEVGDAPGWWKYGPKCGEPIPCNYSISTDDTVDLSKIQIYGNQSDIPYNTNENLKDEQDICRYSEDYGYYTGKETEKDLSSY